MLPGAKRVREGIDPEWLNRAAERDPVLHAYALWDLTCAPESTRFVSFGGDGPGRSYLLIWQGDPEAPVVHWVGDDPEDLPLLASIPPEVSIAVVPERAVEGVRGRFPVANSEPLLIMARPPAAPPPPGERPPAVRLTPAHSDALARFAERYPEMLTRPYRTLDLESEYAWGSFEGGELLGVARATVRLPRVWIVSGVFVAPTARGRGHGWALAGTAASAAHATGAAAGLFVRERNPVAVRLYGRMGFRPVARRVWVEMARTRVPATSAG
jgi:GNAT superfamily N-acetyltransferase